jgi:hypothetical protein
MMLSVPYKQQVVIEGSIKCNAKLAKSAIQIRPLRRHKPMHGIVRGYEQSSVDLYQ